MDEEFRRVIDGEWLRGCMEESRDWGHLVMRAKWTEESPIRLVEEDE